MNRKGHGLTEEQLAIARDISRRGLEARLCERYEFDPADFKMREAYFSGAICTRMVFNICSLGWEWDISDDGIEYAPDFDTI